MDRSTESETKIERVRQWLDRSGSAGVLLESNANFSWITAGGRGYIPVSEEKAVASVLVTQQHSVVITTNIEGGRLPDEELPGCFEVAEYSWWAPSKEGNSPVDQVVRDLAGSDDVVSDLGGAGRKAAGPGLNQLRTVLLEPEIERYRKLGHDAAFVLESACRAVASKDSEFEMAARVAAGCQEKGMDAVVNLVAADDRITRYRHPLPTSLRVSRTLMAVLVARRGGLHACLTRMISFGEPDPELVEGLGACAAIDARMQAASTPGTSLAKVMEVAIEQYAAEGFSGEWQNHHQGGITGYAGREAFATPASETALENNQAVAWNPSVPGAKSEDTVLITGSGIEVLTESGHWPLLDIEVGGETYRRPGLLTR